tara:strand:- start:56 stop:280 length:225 start_codon:yes stop_codon:yes gene_type:complete
MATHNINTLIIGVKDRGKLLSHLALVLLQLLHFNDFLGSCVVNLQDYDFFSLVVILDHEELFITDVYNIGPFDS